MNRILVLGSCGFMGTHLLHYWRDKYELLGVDDFSHICRYWKKEISPNWYPDMPRIVEYHLGNGGLDKHINNFCPDVVVHLAAQINVDLGYNDPAFTVKNNVLSTLEVLEFCRFNNCKMVYTSSSEVYGDPRVIPQSEGHPLTPKHIYGATKVMCEQMIQKYRERFNMDVNIMRPFNTFGEFQNDDGYGAVIMKFLRRIKRLEAPQIWGTGKQSRDYVYIEDLLKAFDIALEEDFKGLPINFCYGKDVTINELASVLLELTEEYRDIELKAEHIENPRGEGEVYRLCGSNYRARSMFRWRPKIRLYDGLKNVVKYYMEEE